MATIHQFPANSAAYFLEVKIDDLDTQIRNTAEDYATGGEGLMSLGGIGLISELVVHLPQGEMLRAAVEGVACLGVMAAGAALWKKGHGIRQPLAAERTRLQTVLDRAA